MITYGTNPGMGVSINAPLPEPSQVADPMARDSITKALAYMGLEGGKPLVGHPIDVVFIGSCTNSRISDLRTAAGLLKGRKVSPKVRVMVVPGSQEVKRQAIAEGLPEIFRAAGCEWREPGCSMCIAMNGDQLSPGQYSVSTSNRNFEGRQGQGRAHLPGQPADRRRQRHHRRSHRCEDTAMTPFTNFESRMVTLPLNNVDTDQIIPARFLKTTSKQGLDKQLFNDWRYDAAGNPNPDFVLNRPESQGVQVLLAGDNFGCGSSREHARGRSPSGASARSSPPASPISSSRTR